MLIPEQERWKAAEARSLAVLKRAQDRGVLTASVPDWWLLQTFYSIIYVAAESVHALQQGGPCCQMLMACHLRTL